MTVVKNTGKDDAATQSGLILGLGCARGVSIDEVSTLARKVLSDAGYPTQTLVAVATLDARALEPALLTLAADLDVPLLSFSAARLEQELHRLATPSPEVYRLTGCHGVAEAAAFAAAKGQARLVARKQKSARATAAIVETSNIQAVALDLCQDDSGASCSRSLRLVLEIAE
jgi:cobalamin biosynthesis protein CbiG